MLDYITANLPLFADLDRKLIVKIEDIGEVNFEQANFLINGEALKSLKKLPNSLVQTVITSPPYYGQRDYCTEEQIGIEENPDEYISRLLEIFDEVKRVLKEMAHFG